MITFARSNHVQYNNFNDILRYYGPIVLCEGEYMKFHIFEPEGKDLTRERSSQLCTQPRASAYWYWSGVYNYDGWSSRVKFTHVLYDTFSVPYCIW